MTPTDTATSTPTPIPPGFVVGEVFDDGNALRVHDFVVAVVSSQLSVVSMVDGSFSAQADAGIRWIEISKDGYTRSMREVVVPPSGAVRMRDARLTELAPSGTAGGETGEIFASDLSTPAGVGSIALEVTSGLSTGDTVILTPLSPQGVIAPLPLGWSVLGGVDLQVDPDPTGPIAAALRIPRNLIVPDPGLDLVAVRWSATHPGGPVWVRVADPILVDVGGIDHLEMPVTAPGQIAVVVADAGVMAPQEGEPLPGIGAQSPQSAIGAIVANPEVIFSSKAERARVFADVADDEPTPVTLVSGTVIEADLYESYDRRDGGFEVGAVSRQDLAGYQVSMGDGGAIAGVGIGDEALALYFVVGPSLDGNDIPLANLLEGRIEIATDLADIENPAIVEPGAESTTATSPSGMTVTLDEGGATDGTILTIRDTAAGDLPAGIGPEASFVLDVAAGAIDPAIAATVNLGVQAAVGELFVLGRTTIIPDQGRVVSQAVAFGIGLGQGNILVQQCRTAGMCLPGFGERGGYALFRMPSGIAAVQGAVRDAGASPEPDQVIENAGVEFVAVSEASGGYLLPVHPGSGLAVTVVDRANDRTATANEIDVPSPDDIANADLTLAGVAPRVINVDPPNHAGGVAADAVLRVWFSEPLDAASVTDTAIQLRQRQEVGAPVPAAKRLSLESGGRVLVITPADDLVKGTVYEIEIGAAVADRQGVALETAPFVSDFTTDGVFNAAGLEPGTLWVTVPERLDGQGMLEIAPNDETGAVMVCGAAALALPGTLVDVTHYHYGEDVPSGTTTTLTATEANGTLDINTNCAGVLPEADYAGRCLTEVSPGVYEPGSFCVAFEDVAAGDRFLVGIEDAFGNRVEIDAGNMRDEETGAEVMGPAGGVVTFPGDERYSAIVPEGAFDLPTVVQITPLTDPPIGDHGGDLTQHSVLTSFDQDKVELVGAVRLDFEGVAAVNIDISVPAPVDAVEDDQYIVTQVINFRGLDEQTMVDVASVDLDADLVTTEFFEGLPLIVTSGLLGVHRANECIAFATGFAKIGDTFAAGVIPGGLFGASLPFAVTTTSLSRFTVPVPCNQPLTIEITQYDTQPIDDELCGGPTGLSRGQSCQLLGVLTDDINPPAVEDTSVLDGDIAADPLKPLEVAYSESLDPNSVTDDSCEVVDSEGRNVEGRCKLSNDGRVVRFVPDIRLRFDEEYTFRIQGVLDLGGNAPVAPYQAELTTFAPRIVSRIQGLDARDVVWIEPTSLGLSPCVDLIAVAEGGTHEDRQDHQGGIVVYDVTEPLRPTRLAEVATAGTDHALDFVVASQPLVTADGGSYGGPFLLSVDGIGDDHASDRFGSWRIHELRQDEGVITIEPIATRLLNQSAETFAALNGGDPQSTMLGSAIGLIPNDLGVPLGVSGFGSQVAYVANSPFIGLQAIALDELVTAQLTVPQVDATLRGVYGDVDTLVDKLVAVAQRGSQWRLGLIDGGLSGVQAHELLPGRAITVLGVPGWLARPEFGSEATVAVDLVLVSGPGVGVGVYGADPNAGSLSSQDIGGVGLIRTAGEPNGLSVDADSRLLFVADGSAGMTVVDLETPGGTKISQERGEGAVDERVLSSTSLFGAKARSVAIWDSPFDVKTVAVAAGDEGVFLIELGILEAAPVIHQVLLAASSATNTAVSDDCEDTDRIAFSPGRSVLDDNCSGFDRIEESEPWVMVPLSGVNAVKANSAGPNEKLISVLPGAVATVMQSGGVASISSGKRESTLSISGIAVGDARVRAVVDEAGAPEAIQEELNVSVRAERSLRVAVRRILLPAEDPSQRKRLPSQGEMQSYLDLVFKRQANVALTVELLPDEVVDYDVHPTDGGLSCGEALLGLQCAEEERGLVVDNAFVEEAVDLKNIFVLGALVITDPGEVVDGKLVDRTLHGATDEPLNITFLQDPTDNDILQTMAHEIGHLLGLEHTLAAGDLMLETDQPKRSGCRLRLVEWNRLNPMVSQ